MEAWKLLRRVISGSWKSFHFFVLLVMFSLDLSSLVIFTVRGHLLRLAMEQFNLDPKNSPDFARVFGMQFTMVGVIGVSFFCHSFYLMHVLSTVSVVKGINPQVHYLTFRL